MVLLLQRIGRSTAARGVACPPGLHEPTRTLVITGFTPSGGRRSPRIVSGSEAICGWNPLLRSAAAVLQAAGDRWEVPCLGSRTSESGKDRWGAFVGGSSVTLWPRWSRARSRSERGHVRYWPGQPV